MVTLLPRSKLCLNPQLPKPNKPQLLRLQRPRLAARAPGGPREKGPDAAAGAAVKPGLRGLGQDGRQLPTLKMACPRAALEPCPRLGPHWEAWGQARVPACASRAGTSATGRDASAPFPHRLCGRSREQPMGRPAQLGGGFQVWRLDRGKQSSLAPVDVKSLAMPAARGVSSKGPQVRGAQDSEGGSAGAPSECGWGPWGPLASSSVVKAKNVGPRPAVR